MTIHRVPVREPTRIRAVAFRTVRYVRHTMGMPITLALRGRHTDDDKAQAAWAQVMRQLHEVDEMFSTYRPDPFVSRLNSGDISLVDCPPEVAEVLALGETARQESGGAFDTTLPGPDGQPILDPSGVVKGWAVEKAAATLKALPDTDFCFAAGGDMTCHTVDVANPPWRIGIEDPTGPSRVLAVVPLSTGGIATSGTTHRGQHLLDPRTGRAPAGIASVTVVAPSLIWADIDATAAYAKARSAPSWLRTRPGRSELIVWADGSTTTVRPHQ